MTYVSPDLERMAKRAALPITCYWQDDFWELEWPGDPGSSYCNGWFGRSSAEARAAYLRLCESLESAETLPSAATAADCSASCSPEGVR